MKAFFRRSGFYVSFGVQLDVYLVRFAASDDGSRYATAFDVTLESAEGLGIYWQWPFSRQIHYGSFRIPWWGSRP